MRRRTTSPRGPGPTSELVLELALRPEDEARSLLVGRDVDRRFVERRGELGSDEDPQAVVLGHVVAVGRRIGEAEARP